MAFGSNPEFLKTEFGIELPAPKLIQQRFNIPPSEQINVIVRQGNEKVLDAYKWGLIPHWATNDRLASSLTNARAEGITDTPSYRDSFRLWRCIVPMNGFYEWTSPKIGGKQPYYFSMKDKPIFGVASIFSIWKNPDGNNVHTVSLITCAPNPLVNKVHDRMPAVLRKEDYEVWLQKEAKPYDLLAMLRPYNETEMQSWPVTQKMSNTDFQGEACIRPISITQRTLA